jgi:ficolin
MVYLLGLVNIASLCKLGDQELRIEMINWRGERRIATYKHFHIQDTSDLYRLSVSGFSGNAGKSNLLDKI